MLKTVRRAESGLFAMRERHIVFLKALARASAVIWLAMLGPASARGQLAEIVTELDLGLPQLESSAGLTGLTAAPEAGRVFFTGGTYVTGWEVWVTDGSREGTRMLGDFCPGTCPIEAPLLRSLGDRVVWVSERDGESVGTLLFDLWASDGTPGGTHRLLSPEAGALTRSGGALFEGSFFFPVGDELWITGGTSESTFPLAAGLGEVRDFVPFGGELLFLAGDTLWATDGSAPGTRLIDGLALFTQPRDLRTSGSRLFLTDDGAGGAWLHASLPGTTSFDPRPAIAAPLSRRAGFPVIRQGDLYAVAVTAASGEELWRTGGAPGSGRPVTDFRSPTPFEDLIPEHLEVLGGRPILVARDGSPASPATVWTSDGTAAGFRRLVDCPGGDECLPVETEDGLSRLPDRVVFPSVGPGCAERIFVTDGTPAGTRTLQGILDGSCATNLGNARRIGDDLYFLARGSDGAPQLWKTDGTVAGTGIAATGLEGAFSQRPPGRWIAPLDGRRVFALESFSRGFAPWVTAGPEGATPLAQLDPDRRNTDSIRQLALGRRAIFSTPYRFRFNGPNLNDTVPASVWSSAGTAESTTALTLREDATQVALHGTAGPRAFFSEEEAQDGPTTLRVSDGTVAGTRDLRTFQGPQSGRVRGPVELGGSSWFWARDGGRLELWRTDGTAGGTSVVTPIAGEFAGRGPKAAGGLLFFEVESFAVDFIERSALWVSDGTAGGTRILVDFGSQVVGFGFSGFVERDGRILFLVHFESRFGIVGSFELWSTDGTPEGTGRVIDRSFSGHSFVDELLPLGDEIFFVSQGLWRTDGTASGTVPVFPTTSQDSSCEQPGAVFGDRLLLSLFEPETGCELWLSDGTTVGTARLRDVHPGPGGSGPQELRVAAGRAFFTANDGVHGRELWQTDGTGEGTRLVQDLWPGGDSSRPSLLTVAEDRLFFFADDGLRGREPWSLALGAAAPACPPGATALCLGAGRFRIEAHWRDFSRRRGTGTAVPLTGDTGSFWFFDDENIEVMVKVLDGKGVNEHYWTFFGALSNVEYWLTVTDSETGLARRYYNPSRIFASVGDTRSFGPLGASFTRSPGRVSSPPAPPPRVREHLELPRQEGCTPSGTTLCLNGGRFAVEASFMDFQGVGDAATGVPFTDDTGIFWFFRETNLELIVKVLDGRDVNGNFWIFYGSLSNVDFDLTVTDTATGRVRTYLNRSRRFASVGDTGAFEGP